MATGITNSGGQNPPHTHGFTVSKEGRGFTTSTSTGPGHVHQIRNFGTQSAGRGPHTHGSVRGIVEQDKGSDYTTGG